MHQIIFENVNVITKRQSILRDINLSIPQGKIIAVIGESGSGKTTFLKLVLNLLLANQGWSITGTCERFPGLKMAYINQNPSLQVFKNFVYEEFPSLSKEAAAQFLQGNGFAHLCDKRCLELSQGEKTIVAILRALSLKVDVIALDEVMVNLAATKRQWLTKVLVDFKHAGGTVLLADHCPSIIDFADAIMLAADRQLIATDKLAAATFFTAPIAATPDPAMLASTEDKLEIHAVVDSQIASSLQQSIAFTATNGEIIGISGDNGSGKSTLIEIICGIKKPASGVVMWNAKELQSLRSRRKLLSLCTAYNMQQFLMDTVEQELALALRGCRNAVAQQIIANFALADISQSAIAALSYGAKQRLAIALVMLADTPILIFDEPTYGMDKLAFNAFIRSVHLLANQGKIILVVSHDATLLEALLLGRTRLCL